MGRPSSSRGIGKAAFIHLVSGFLEASGYEIMYHGKKVEYPMDVSVFIKKLVLFTIAAVAAAQRVTYSHLFEMEFVRSKRKSEFPLLKFRPHLSLSRYFKANPDTVHWEGDQDFDSLEARTYEGYNRLADMGRQIQNRDSIVTTDPK
jgi:hypothetical protein